MNNIFQNKKVRKFILGIAIACALLFCCYLVFALQPLFVFISPFTEFETLQGMEYYNSGGYKDLEMGKQFIDTFLDYEIAAECEVIDFFYRDYKPYDSIIYGKRADIYAIDLYTGENYEEVKSFVQEKGTYFTDLSDDEQSICLYLMPNDSGKEGLFLFAMEDDHRFLRFLFISDREESDYRFNNEIRYSLDGGPSFEWGINKLFEDGVWSSYKTGDGSRTGDGLREP